jgi:hypothetical protein
MSKPPSKKKPDLLWHYTNWAGLNGILKTGKLWASHIRYLNDSNEFRHALKIFETVANRAIRNNLVLNWQTDVLDALTASKAFDSCVTSFSTKGDDLSQWRGYTNPAPGFALGFDKGQLATIATKENFRLVACDYDRSSQTAKLQKITTNFLATYSLQPKDASLPDRAKSLKWKMLEKFGRLAPELKVPQFAAESEWRLISEPIGNHKGLDFHVSQTLLVPHLALSIGIGTASPLAAVRIGPNAHMKLQTNSVSLLMQSHGFTDVEVLSSKVPFRNW